MCNELWQVLLVLQSQFKHLVLTAEVNWSHVALLDVEALMYVGFYWFMEFWVFITQKWIKKSGCRLDDQADIEGTLLLQLVWNGLFGFELINLMYTGLFWTSVNKEELGFSVRMTSVAVTCRHFRRFQERLLFFVLLLKKHWLWDSCTDLYLDFIHLYF